MKLQDLRQSEQGLTATSTLLAMKAAMLDCTGVEFLTQEQMTALFSGIPQEWDFAQLGEVFDPETLTESLAQQLFDWVNQRQGRTSPTTEAQFPSKAIAHSLALDIFSLRDEAERGFKLDTATGYWGEPNQETASDTVQTGVNLMVSDTCNILVVEPLSLPDERVEEFIITLQYTLERAIAACYKLEPDELASERLGEGKTLLFWEAAEGGAGVLTQILDDPHAFQKLAEMALEICHFRVAKTSCTQACYECLLSYQNQFDHPHLNRHLIKLFLSQLTVSTLKRDCPGESREDHYQRLLQQTDPNSEFERVVLSTIYEQGIRLPDTAQELIPEANCKPDFLYKKTKVALFCDGSVHDSPMQREQDRVIRENLQHNSGYEVISCKSYEDWQQQLKLLKTII